MKIRGENYQGTVYVRADGTFVIDSQTGAKNYHVIPGDPAMSEVLAYQTSVPSAFLPEPLHMAPAQTLAQVQAQAETAIDAGAITIRSRGMSYKGLVYNADATAQEAVGGIANLVALGITPAFPLDWYIGDHTLVPFQSLDDFKGYAAALAQFVTGLFHSIANAKSAVGAATTVEQAWAAYTNFMQGFGIAV